MARQTQAQKTATANKLAKGATDEDLEDYLESESVKYLKKIYQAETDARASRPKVKAAKKPGADALKKVQALYAIVVELEGSLPKSTTRTYLRSAKSQVANALDAAKTAAKG